MDGMRVPVGTQFWNKGGNHGESFLKEIGLLMYVCRWSHHDQIEKFEIYFPFTGQCDGWLYHVWRHSFLISKRWWSEKKKSDDSPSNRWTVNSSLKEPNLQSTFTFFYLRLFPSIYLDKGLLRPLDQLPLHPTKQPNVYAHHKDPHTFITKSFGSFTWKENH